MKSDYLNPKVYNSVYMYMTYDNCLALRVALCTGLRIGDVLKIRKSDISGRTLKYTAEKTGKTGKKTLTAELCRELIRNADGVYCFPHRLDKTKHRTRQAVYKDLRQACKRAGLSGHYSPHSTRKTYAVEVMHTEGLSAVQSELQHDRTETTMLYAFSDLVNAANGGSDGTTYSTVKKAVTDALIAFFGSRKICDHSELTFSEK